MNENLNTSWLSHLLLMHTGLPPLAAFGWVVATHLSLYPLVLIIPVCFMDNFSNIWLVFMELQQIINLIVNVFSLIHFQVIFLLGYGLDAPPRKLFLPSNLQVVDEKSVENGVHKTLLNKPTETSFFCWRRVIFFFCWACIWITYVLFLCASSVREYGGLGEMFNRYKLALQYYLLYLTHISVKYSESLIYSHDE